MFDLSRGTELAQLHISERRSEDAVDPVEKVFFREARGELILWGLSRSGLYRSDSRGASNWRS
jgi:hypothetical protein